MCETRNVHDFYAVGVVKIGTGTVNLLYHDMVNSALATSIDDIGISCDNEPSGFDNTLLTFS